ncbi:cell division protein FtsQ/DivIB [Hymenobacter sp. 102]|uniref:cell division protein FtsQ/DivIB n=1 Tax=Hymenobacter sp. 102 TaxID=3403152 RepID=UPI003CE76786
MELKRKANNLLFATGCLLMLVGLGAFAAFRQANRPVGEVSVSISNEFNNFFISEREVTSLLTRHGQDQLEGANPADINLKELEGRLKAHSFVKDAQVYRDLAGNLHADVRQNRPIARLVHADSRQDSYLDAEGHKLPLSPLFTARVVPVSRLGGQPLSANFFQDSAGTRYLEFLRYIDEKPFWRAQVAEVFVGPSGRISFTQQVGDQRVEFGFPENISEKFAKLMVFYRQIPPVLGWDTYHRVNVEFKDQIICE